MRTRGKATDLADRGVHVREADYSSPRALGAALDGVDRLLLISSSEAGQRVAHHTNVIQAARTAGTGRIVPGFNWSSQQCLSWLTVPLVIDGLGLGS